MSSQTPYSACPDHPEVTVILCFQGFVSHAGPCYSLKYSTKWILATVLQLTYLYLSGGCTEQTWETLVATT